MSVPQARLLNAADPLPEHVAQTTQAIAKLHADHHRAATPLERAVARVVDRLGRPIALIALVAVVIVWVVLNTVLPRCGLAAFDPPPFAWLEVVATIVALCVALLILATQRRDDQLAQHREQLTLQLAILSEQKIAKVIELLEESRRDNPLLDNRVDNSATAMATPADPQTLGDAIKGMKPEDTRSKGVAPLD